jgi:peptide/nickel transport system permease protein
MINYILKRLLHAIPTIILLSVIVFTIMKFIPGDPVDIMFGEKVTEEIRGELHRQLGLDKPVVVQYLVWIGQFVQGDFGVSIFHQIPVAELIAERLPATIYMAIAVILFSMLVAIPLGVWAAIRRKTWTDMSIMGVSLFGLSVPDFVFGLVAILCFSLYLRIFPSMGYVGPGEDFGRFMMHLTLPVLTLGTHMMGVITRLTRSSMLDQLNSDYVRTHRAQGIGERLIFFKLALKNALIPIVTIIGMRFGHLLGGTVIIETVFNWPGIGLLILQSIRSRDFPVVLAASLMLGIIFVVLNLLVDVSYRALDPRIRLR